MNQVCFRIKDSQWRHLLIVFVCTGLLCALASAADTWELQYEHIDKEYDLRLVDVAFIDPQRGLAVGFIDSRTRDRQRAVNLITTDGKNWKLVEVKKRCNDVFALRSGILFAACEDGIYRSDEMGSDWKRLAKLNDIESVWFLSEQRGFAVGASKGFFETQDGGNRWAPVAPKPELTTNADFTTLRHIHFVSDKLGFITGWSRPPTNRDRIPDWLMPDRAMRQRDTPHVNIFLDTNDGGANWRSQQVSMFGEVVSTELGLDQLGLTLVNFSNGFEFPAEVFAFNWPNGSMQRVFREKRRAVTDIVVPPSGPVYLAAVEPQGQLYWSPIPGRLKVMRSTDLVSWEEMEVDYRASARRASLEAYDAQNVWMVTDTGMILKLKRDGEPLAPRAWKPSPEPKSAEPESAKPPAAASPAPATPELAP